MGERARTVPIAPVWSLARVVRCQTPHQRPRQHQVTPRLIVLHCDAGRTEAGSIEWIGSSQSQGSYHVMIGRDGVSYRFVDDVRCAFHAGRAEWAGVSAVNDLSLGLCFANRNDGTEALTDAQVLVAQFWVAHWIGAYPAMEDVVTHAAIARPAGRKTDPDGLVPHPNTRALVPAVPNFQVMTYRAMLARRSTP